ncbi:mitotic checkpoint protein BUB3 [Hibiscus syriacus]|uniref:Mitotic checkpoint protein BUB3 n=1 Tax=Hibiscus syriacus TaxID=106335 RepID=A0A6A3CLS8_HIBSY|nr:mitotic checkpoint protein BUB3 [Hibiscus syriacus]
MESMTGLPNVANAKLCLRKGMALFSISSSFTAEGGYYAEPRGPPPAFASDPLINVTGGIEYDGNSSPSVVNDEGYSAAAGPSNLAVTEIMEIDGPNSAGNYIKASNDEDGNRKKYSRRGPLYLKFLRALIPFWSSALPTLPVTAPPHKDSPNADGGREGRMKHQRSTRMDQRKILLVIAIMACMATMGILYYRISQRALGEDVADEEQL